MAAFSTFTYAKKYYVSQETEFVTEPDAEFGETYAPPDDLINLLADNLVVYDKVGIGTTNPGNGVNLSGITGTTTKLDVRGKTLLWNQPNVGYATAKSDMDTYAVLKLRGHVSDSTNMQFAHMGNGNAMGVQVTNAANNANWDIVLNPFGGNLGIGTTNPTSTLQVAGDVTPSVPNTYDLGTESLRWKKIYATTIEGTITGNADTAYQVSTGTTNGIGTYYPTFVDFNNSTRQNEFLYTDSGISYNPSTNLLSVNGIIESSNDYPSPNNEGGQFVLRGKSGTSSRWCIDNHTNSTNTIVNQFRIFREDDGTSLNGLAYVGITTIGEFIIGSGGGFFPTGTPNQQLQVQSGAYISGNLGIGITNSTYKLHTVHNNNDIGLSTGSIPLSPGIVLQNSGGDAALWLGNNNRVSAGLGILVNNGSVIDFSGKYSVIDTYGSLTFGRIGAFKENNTSNDFSGYLSLYSRPTAGSLVEAIRIDSSQRVGIGTTNPGEKLQVDGNIRVGISTTSNYIAFRGTFNDDQIPYINTFIGERIYDYSGVNAERSELLLFKGNDRSLDTSGPDRIRLAAAELRFDTYDTVTSPSSFESAATLTNITNKMILTYDGNLGIGTTNPTSKLQVNDTSSTNVYSNLTYRTDANIPTGIAIGVDYFPSYTTPGTQTSYAIANNSVITGNVIAGSTNNGYIRAGNDVALRGRTTTDNGTLVELTGRRIAVGHWHNVPIVVNPITTNAFGIIVNGLCHNGTITNIHGIYIPPIEKLAGASVINAYGIYSSIQSTDATNSSYNLYIPGSAQNFISGNLGIGTTIPTSKLHVSGNVTVTGSVSKGSGSFVIDHPLNETKNLVHSFVEGPRADLIYRGTVSLIDGSATINLDEEYELIPGTWKALCRNPQVWISNIDGWTKCRGTVEDGILIIEAQTASNESVNWLVIAERKDKHMYDTEWTDDNGRPILEPVKL